MMMEEHHYSNEHFYNNHFYSDDWANTSSDEPSFNYTRFDLDEDEIQDQQQQQHHQQQQQQQHRFFNADVSYASVEGESFDQHNHFHYFEEYQEDEEIEINNTFSRFKKVFSKLKMYVKGRIKVLMQKD
ncbi:hypothetical protein KGF54_005567 [Candida jiufengensis]|uniref:uncharacterized protein n=1 Tax=Candida jiufengensis TaxID=497108 RepID=UPI0022253108|nr:uncharacterized protein KGF54_005567 [Candida jiufengensis]KAI5949332.1 hypothetical protein KGF54_005567 [Candida jiufengensis]